MMSTQPSAAPIVSVTPNSTRRISLITLLIATIGVFATDSYLPALPAITQAFHTTSTLIQWTITAYLLGFSLSQLVYGSLSDRYGRRRILLVGFCIAFVGSLLCVLSTTPTTLIIARLIQGIGIAAGAATFRSILRDTFSGAKLAEVVATISTFFALVPAVAPVLGAQLQHAFNWQANFIFLAFYVCFSWITVYFFLPETNQHINPNAIKIKVIIANYRILLGSRVFMGYTLCSGLAFSTIIAYALVSPYLFQTLLKLSPVQYGWLAIYIATGMFVGKVANQYLLKKMDISRIVPLGISLTLIAASAMLIITGLGILNVTAVMLPVVISITGCALIFSNAAAGAFIPFPKIAGTAGGLYGCLQILASFITGQIISLFQINSQMPLAMAFLSLSLLGLACYFLLLKGSSDKSTIL
jgi:DHA1 family 2-module integral membrane pump EmrD-like MFS transporter